MTKTYWGDAVSVLKRYGAIVDIGQISLPDRRRLAQLRRQRLVSSEETLDYPRPKTRWVWRGPAASDP